MNLAKLFDRIQKDVTSLSPLKLAQASVSVCQDLGLTRAAVRETSKLEVRIADDFDDLPKDVAEDFWADAWNATRDDELEPSEDT